MTVLSTYIEQRLLEIDGKKLRKISKNVIFEKTFLKVYIEIIMIQFLNWFFQVTEDAILGKAPIIFHRSNDFNKEMESDVEENRAEQAQAVAE